MHYAGQDAIEAAIARGKGDITNDHATQCSDARSPCDLAPWLLHGVGADGIDRHAQRSTAVTERTILSLSERVLVPGATLQAGTYVFRLANSNANRHVVRITRQDTSDVVALTHAVPMKRLDPKGDVVLKFSPNQPGSPPAIRGWFYPGSLYGHEFIYSDEQARDIASRTKTIVLSSDVVGSDVEKGTRYAYSPSGGREIWRADSGTVSEWREWERGIVRRLETARTKPRARR